jgi:hypothetical protein
MLRLCILNLTMSPAAGNTPTVTKKQSAETAGQTAQLCAKRRKGNDSETLDHLSSPTNDEGEDNEDQPHLTKLEKAIQAFEKKYNKNGDNSDIQIRGIQVTKRRRSP